MREIFLILLTLHIFFGDTYAQTSKKVSITLEEAIKIAHERSLTSASAQHNYRSSYWQYKFYRSNQLPILNLRADLGNFNRSISQLQDPQSGLMTYVHNNNLQNSISLSIDQNITATGGSVYIYSSLSRTDQFAPYNVRNYYTQPITFSYVQPIGGFNEFKWQKKIEPRRYEVSRKIYLEQMEDVTLRTVSYFFDYMLQKQSLELAERNYKNNLISHPLKTI